MSLDTKRQRWLEEDMSQAVQILQAIVDIANRYKQDALVKKTNERLNGLMAN